MSRATLAGAIITTAIVAAIVFVGVAVHELNYASSHPYAYGPAKVIAWAGGAGALLSITVAAIGGLLIRERHTQRER